MSLRSQLSAMRRAARPTLARRSPLKLSTIRQTGVISGELHKAFKLIRQQMHSRIRSEFGSAHSLGQSDRNNRDMPTAPCTPSRHTAPKYTINSANRGRTGPNPYRFNSATSSIRIWSGTLEKEHGPRRGAKHYTRVIYLLDEHPIEIVQRAVEMGRCAAGYDVETILLQVRRRCQDATPAPLDRAQQPEPVRDVNVPPPDLSKFNQFLSHGEPDHE
jgi:hypothetical protein